MFALNRKDKDGLGKNTLRENSAKHLKQPKRRVISPLTWRILMVNVIALVVPIFGLLYLGPYKDHLIKQEMEALKTHGEIFSGALGEGAISILDNGQHVLNLVPARHILRRLSQPTNVRARLFAPDGGLVADSRVLSGLGDSVRIEDLPEPESLGEEMLNPILDMMGLVESLLGEETHPRYQDNDIATVLDYPEAQNALNGEITGYVREGDQGQLVLSVALPVQRYYRIFGSLMLSTQGDKIEAALREVRLNILLVFAMALVVTILLSIYLANAITRPLHKLADAAERVKHSVGRDDEHIPDFTHRGDEIGELSGALREMTKALRKRLTAIERFAADVSHEIKNPLTSLRSAVETVARVQDPSHQKKLMHIIHEDVKRLDRLISDISDASRLDSELSRAHIHEIDLGGLLRTMVEMRNVTALEREDTLVELTGFDMGPYMVEGNESRLAQVFRNLIDNAASFSPPDGMIRIIISKKDGFVKAEVEDQGPGIPENKLEAIFDRFYTERPATEEFGQHSGLGLSISKQIIEAHGGAIFAENLKTDEGQIVGAKFVINLPNT